MTSVESIITQVSPETDPALLAAAMQNIPKRPVVQQQQQQQQTQTTASTSLAPKNKEGGDLALRSTVSLSDEEEDDHKEHPQAETSKSCWSSIFCCFRSSTKPVTKESSRDQTESTISQSDVTIKHDRDGDKKYDSSKTDSKSVAISSSASTKSDDSKTQIVQTASTSATASTTAAQLAHLNANPTTTPRYLMAPLAPEDAHKKTLVLDLDETLVHSSFKPVSNADFVISIELENVIHRVYVLKRPGVDAFLKAVGQKFEVVVFTASLAKYADPLLDILDKHKVVKKRLFREACVFHYGNYVKDLSMLGRRLESTIIIDNSPFSYMFQPDNAIPILSWFNDKNDRHLYDLVPFLDSIAHVDDVCTVLAKRRYQQNV